MRSSAKSNSSPRRRAHHVLRSILLTSIGVFSVLSGGLAAVARYDSRSDSTVVVGTATAPAPAAFVDEVDTATTTVDLRNGIVTGAGKSFLATAYCLKGQTASGVLVRRGIIAADPKVLPLGSVVRLRAGKYSGIYTVMDTGSKIVGRRIDIYMPTRAEAMNFGSRSVTVEVIRHGWNPDVDTAIVD